MFTSRTGLARLLGAALLSTSMLLGAPALAGKRDDTLRFANDQAPESGDPYFNNVRIGVTLGSQIWDTLIYRDPKTNAYVGNLAPSWTPVKHSNIDVEPRQRGEFT